MKRQWRRVRRKQGCIHFACTKPKEVLYMLVIKFKFKLYRQTCLEQKVISSSTFWEESGGISFTLSHQVGMEDGDRGRVFCNALVHWDLALPGSHALCWSVWQILCFCLSTETTSMSRDCKNILTELRCTLPYQTLSFIQRITFEWDTFWNFSSLS